MATVGQITGGKTMEELMSMLNGRLGESYSLIFAMFRIHFQNTFHPSLRLGSDSCLRELQFQLLQARLSLDLLIVKQSLSKDTTPPSD